MPEDIQIPIETPGGDKAKRTLGEIAKAEQRVGKEAEKAGRKGTRASADTKRGFRGMGGAIDGATKSVSRLVGAYMGMAGVEKLLASIQARHERAVEVTERHAEAMRSVLALSSLQGERKETVAGLYKFAAFAGRPMEEIAPAYYSLLGGTAGMGRARQQGLFRQALLMGKTDFRASPEALVSLFSTIGAQQPDLTPTQVGNLVSRTIEQAKSTPGEMAQYLPSIMTTGRTAGAEVPTLAAMFSFATRYGGGVAESGTAVRSALLGLLAPAPELQKKLGQYGLPAGGIMERIRWLGARGADLPPEIAAALGGRRGIQAIGEIGGRPAEFAAEVEIMRGALGAKGSLIQGRLASMYGEVPSQRWLDQLKGLRLFEEERIVEPDLLRKEAQLELMRQTELVSGVAPEHQWAAQWLRRRKVGLFGIDPLWPMNPTEKAYYGLLDKGYHPRDILRHVLPAMQGRARAMGENTVDPFDITPPEGQAFEGWFGSILGGAGVQPMQGSTVVIQQYNQGGTQYNQFDRREPAGRPLQPSAAR